MPPGAEGDEQNLRTANETSSIKKEMSGRRGEVAEQLEFFPVQSPCRGICQSDERGYCRGCMRSRDERLLRKLRAAKQDSAEEPQQPSLF